MRTTAAAGKSGPLVFGGDVAQRQSFVDAIDALEARFGRFDVLVNNAMWARYAAIEDTTEEMMQRMLGSGFSSIVWGTQVAMHAMARAGGGSIVNIASTAALARTLNAHSRI